MKWADPNSVLCGCSNGSLAHYLLHNDAIRIHEWRHVTKGFVTHIEIDPEDKNRFIAIDTLSQMHVGRVDTRASDSIRSMTLVDDEKTTGSRQLVLIDRIPTLLMGHIDGTAQLRQWTTLAQKTCQIALFSPNKPR